MEIPFYTHHFGKKKLSLTIVNVNEDMKPWQLLFWLNNSAQFILLVIDSRKILGHMHSRHI